MTVDVRFVPKADIGNYSTSLSARSTRAAGMVWFIALAVLRLIDKLNVLGCSIGKSAVLRAVSRMSKDMWTMVQLKKSYITC